jgi:hypothetical protein
MMNSRPPTSTSRYVKLVCVVLVINRSLTTNGKILVTKEDSHHPEIVYSNHDDWSSDDMLEWTEDNWPEQPTEDCEPPIHQEINIRHHHVAPINDIPPHKMEKMFPIDDQTPKTQITHVELVDKTGNQPPDECYVAYDLVDHGAVFDYAKTKAIPPPIDQRVQNVFLKPKVQSNDKDLVERKKQLVEKFPLTVPKLIKQQEHETSAQRPGSREKIKSTLDHSSQSDTGLHQPLEIFVVKSPEQSNEMMIQQMAHQTEINQLVGDLAITRSGQPPDQIIDDGFEVPLVGLNKTLASKENQENSYLLTRNASRTQLTPTDF